MEWLQTLGLSPKQARLYLCLLENGPQNASRLADILGEQRTNIYLITEELIRQELVERDEASPVVRFKITNPEKLQEKMLNQQKELAKNAAYVKKVLPEFLGLYRLHTAESGLAYFEGVKGYFAALEDMNQSSQEVRVFSTAQVNERPDLWDGLQNALQKRAIKKITTRMLVDDSLKDRMNPHDLARKCISLRFWGSNIFESEIAIYGSSVVMTTYDEQLISLVIKNTAIAATFKSIFDTAWEHAT